MKLDIIKDPKLRQRIQQQIDNEDRIKREAQGARPVVQEQEKVKPKGAGVHRTKNKKVDGPSHPRFRVTVVLRYSDNRRRDLDGSTSTLLDCIVRAARRFAAVDKPAPDR